MPSPDWTTALAPYLLDPDVGCVGCSARIRRRDDEFHPVRKSGDDSLGSIGAVASMPETFDMPDVPFSSSTPYLRMEGAAVRSRLAASWNVGEFETPHTAPLAHPASPLAQKHSTRAPIHVCHTSCSIPYCIATACVDGLLGVGGILSPGR